MLYPGLCFAVRIGGGVRQSFFSYGSFSKGYVHFPKFSQFIVEEKQAFVKAEAYRLRCGYPGLIPGENGPLVEGQLWTLEIPDNFWPVLDSLLGFDLARPEKSLFVRHNIYCHVGNHSLIEAQSYFINELKMDSQARLIEGGDWRQDLTQEPPVLSQMAPKQKQYISRLSRSKGRDIVPIQLDLYRELMAMEMIVDKGRRLALTSLGKEASLFLQ